MYVVLVLVAIACYTSDTPRTIFQTGRVHGSPASTRSGRQSNHGAGRGPAAKSDHGLESSARVRDLVSGCPLRGPTRRKRFNGSWPADRSVAGMKLLGT